MHLKYKFVNETVEIEVSEKWASVIKKLDKEEYNSNQREHRHCKNFLDAAYRNYDKHYLSQPVFASVERRELYANLGRTIGLLLPTTKIGCSEIFLGNSGNRNRAKGWRE